MTNQDHCRAGRARRAHRLRHHGARSRLREIGGIAHQGSDGESRTLTSPSEPTVTGVDPDYANNVVTEFRKDVSKPEDVKEPIEMAVIGSYSGPGGW